MEDTLRAVVDFATEKGLDVLILVVMEETLRVEVLAGNLTIWKS